MEYKLINSYIENDDIKHPCIKISETAITPQTFNFSINDLYITDNHISLLTELNKYRFHNNYHVRTLLLAIFMIEKYKIDNNINKEPMTLLNVFNKTINSKLLKLYNNLTIFIEDTELSYTFLIGNYKKKDDIKSSKFKYGMFIIPIEINDNFTFYSGHILSVPFVNISEFLVCIIVKFSTTKYIMYETNVLKEYIMFNKHKQIIYNYYNPFFGNIKCDLRPNLQCNYNNMYVFTIVRIYVNHKIRNLPDLVGDKEDINKIFSTIDLIFENEKMTRPILIKHIDEVDSDIEPNQEINVDLIELNEIIDKNIKEGIKALPAPLNNEDTIGITNNLVQSTSSQPMSQSMSQLNQSTSSQPMSQPMSQPSVQTSIKYINNSTLNTINYYITKNLSRTIFVIHTDNMINSIKVPASNIITKNYNSLAIDQIRYTLTTEIEMSKLRNNINNTPYILITCSNLKKLLYVINSKYIRAHTKKLDVSLKFCDRIIFCNAEYINGDMFACFAVLNNLKYHGALLPDLILQINGKLSNPKITEYKLSGEIETYVTPAYTNYQTKVKFINVRKDLYKSDVTECDYNLINIYNYSYIYNTLFCNYNTIIEFKVDDVTQLDIPYIKFLIHNTAFKLEYDKDITIDYTTVFDKHIYNLCDVVSELIQNNIQIIELKFLSPKQKDILLNSVTKYISMDNQRYISLIKISKLHKSIYSMKDPFERGFNKARHYDCSLFTYCIFAAIYQNYEEFVIWPKVKDVHLIKNITIYEMEMIRDYIIRNNGKFGISDNLTSYCKFKNLNYEIMKHILLKLVNFNEIKRCSNDKKYNFEEFLKFLYVKDILEIKPIILNSTTDDGIIYTIPNDKQIITNNIIIPLESITILTSLTGITQKRLTSFITVPA